MKPIKKKEKKILNAFFLKELKKLAAELKNQKTAIEYKLIDERVTKAVLREVSDSGLKISEKELHKYYKNKRKKFYKKLKLQSGNVELIFLGSGHALPRKSYNTCFVIKNRNEQCFLVDAGGGNQILSQLRKCKLNLEQIEDIFISHTHLDHLLGLFWILRVIGYDIAAGRRKKPLRIYACSSVLNTIREGIKLLSGDKVKNLLGKDVFLIPVSNGEEQNIIGFPIVFFDIGSKKIEQFGFSLEINDKKLVFLGDEPYRENEELYASNPQWLIHEAFCLEKDKEKFKPTEKMHSTVREAAENAQRLQAKELFITHSEDYKDKAKVFKKEADKYFKGKVNIVNDRSVFHLT